MKQMHNRQKLSDTLLHLPHRILKNYSCDNLSQIVLHYIAHPDCFDFRRAAFFIDNPDFDHLIGVAGYCTNECSCQLDELWKEPDLFNKETQRVFDQEIRQHVASSVKRTADFADSTYIKALGKKLGMKQPEFISWDMKHANHGLLVYEPRKKLDEWQQFMLDKAVSFLGFCPI